MKLNKFRGVAYDGDTQIKIKKAVSTLPPLGFPRGESIDILERGIYKDTCAKYNYEVGKIGDMPCHIINYRSIINKRIVAQKYRFVNKMYAYRAASECIEEPTVSELNGISINVFYGQHLWINGGKKLVIVEGEFDVLTISQIQDNEFAVVGLPNGPPSAERIFKSQFKWLSSWEEIIIMFDEDEDGYKAVKSATNILPKNKYKVAHLPMKDPNQMLLSGKSYEIIEILNNLN